MTEDIRAALAEALRNVPDPDARVQRWLSAVPQYAVGRRGRPRASRALAALAVALLSASVAGSRLPSQHLARTLPPEPRIVIVTANACPPGEKRFDEETAGYHVCLPSSWTARQVSADPASGYISAVGFGPAASFGANTLPDTAAWNAPLVISVSDQPAVQASELEQISAPQLLTVARQTADEVTLGGGGRATLLARGDLVYSIQVSPDLADAALAYNEVLRTFSFRGLPYVADPELSAGSG